MSTNATTFSYDDVPCGLLTTSANGTIVRANRTFCAWLGVAREDIVDKRRLQDLLTVGCKIFHQTHWHPLLQIQGSVGEVQLDMVRSDGHTLAMLVNAIRCEQEGQTLHEVALFVATDRKKYERELLLARRRAEELLESERKAQETSAAALRKLEQEAQQRAILAEQLVGIVSHDLRTPLNAVVLGAGMLASGELAPVHSRVVNRMMSAANRASV